MRLSIEIEPAYEVRLRELAAARHLSPEALAQEVLQASLEPPSTLSGADAVARWLQEDLLGNLPTDEEATAMATRLRTASERRTA